MENTKSLSIYSSLRFLWKYAEEFKGNFALFYIGWLIQTFLAILTPILIALMIDEVIYYRNMNFFLRISLIFIVLSVFSCILYFLIYTIHHYLISMYTFRIKSAIFNHAVKAKAGYLSNESPGYIMTLLNKDAGECMHIIIRNVIHFINGNLKLAFCIIFVWFYSWKVGLLLIISLPLTLYVTHHYGKQQRRQTKRYMGVYSHFSSFILEILSGLREIKLMAAEKNAASYFTNQIRDMAKIKITSAFVDLKARQTTNLINLIIELLMYSISALLAFNGEITVGMFIAIFEYFHIASNQIGYLSENSMDMHNRLGNVQRIHDFLEVETEDDWPGTKELRVTEGKIEFKDLSFNYNNRQSLLSNLNLTIDGGQQVAIVGSSGSGKTTLVNVLLGFYQGTSGSIVIDGMDIRDTALKSLRQQIGIVQQEVLIFDGTIRMNLMLANIHATDEVIMAACDKAAIGDFVRSLPDGLDTVVGKGGRGLSGGQKQRLSIARIYLKNPKIIVFDEATSSLDHESERLIHACWEELSSGRTTIIISHRQSSIEKCDRVIELIEGRVI